MTRIIYEIFLLHSFACFHDTERESVIHRRGDDSIELCMKIRSICERLVTGLTGSMPRKEKNMFVEMREPKCLHSES